MFKSVRKKDVTLDKCCWQDRPWIRERHSFGANLINSNSKESLITIKWLLVNSYQWIQMFLWNKRSCEFITQYQFCMTVHIIVMWPLALLCNVTFLALHSTYAIPHFYIINKSNDKPKDSVMALKKHSENNTNELQSSIIRVHCDVGVMGVLLRLLKCHSCFNLETVLLLSLCKYFWGELSRQAAALVSKENGSSHTL